MTAPRQDKAAVYMGASDLQVPGIEAARAAGLWTIVTDRSPTAAGRSHADQFEVVDATDVAALLRLAERENVKRRIVGAYGVADYAFRAVGAIAERFALSIGTPAQFAAMADKAEARARMHAAGVRVPEQLTCEGRDHVAATAATAIRTLPFPVVVKPTDSFNSRGVTVVATPSQARLTQALQAALAAGTRAVIETEIQGTHYNVDGLFCGGAFHPVAITERLFVDEVGRQALSGFEPNDIGAETRAALWSCAEHAARALDQRNGPMTADIVMATDGPVVLEVSPHFHCLAANALRGGSAIRAWFEYLAGAADWQRHLRGDAEVVVGYHYVRSFADGRIFDGMAGHDIALGSGIARQIIPAKALGDTIHASKSSGDMIAVALVRSTGRSEFLSNCKAIESTLDVRYRAEPRGRLSSANEVRP